MTAAHSLDNAALFTAAAAFIALRAAFLWANLSHSSRPWSSLFMVIIFPRSLPKIRLPYGQLVRVYSMVLTCSTI